MAMTGYEVKFQPEMVRRLKESSRRLSYELNKNVTWCDLVRVGADLVLKADGHLLAQAQLTNLTDSLPVGGVQ